MASVSRARRALRLLIGADVSGYKSSVLHRRLRSHARQRGLDDPDAYLDWLEAAGPEAAQEARRLAQSLSVGVSGFFRDPAVFQELEDRVWPRLLASQPNPLRIWSAACARGQEAYSLAIALWRRGGGREGGPAFTVLGTDVDEGALRGAREGLYRERALRGVSAAVLAEAFEPVGPGEWKVRREIRTRVRFQRVDLLAGGTLPVGFDLICCRNFLIYLRRSAQERVLEALHRALAPGGFLVLGTSETLLGRPWGLFEPVSVARRIYRKRGPGGSAGPSAHGLGHPS
ncbi:MAG: hypothetical protein Kow0092_11870 [Deferrisomatales bacterium]